MFNFKKTFKQLFKYLQRIFNLPLRRYNETRVIHHSENFIILNKAYDCKINSNIHNEETVQTFLKEKFPQLASKNLVHEFYFVHRLDYSTSGVICIPSNKKSCQVAAKAIANRSSKKYYVALIRGHPSTDLLNLNYPIGRDWTVTEIEKMTVFPSDIGKSVRKAQTFGVVLEKGIYDNYPATKVLIRPITGRRHQIRVHFSYIGHTIIGDYTYSNKKDVSPFRMFLHSFRMILPNEIESLDIQTEDPFTEKLVSRWSPVLKVFSLEKGFRILDGFVNEQ